MTQKTNIIIEIPLNELRKEDRIFRWYYHFKASLALYNRKPFQVALYRSGNKRQTMIIFMECDNGNTYSRKVSGSIADMAFLRSWLSNDFEDIEIELINYPDAEQMLEEYKQQHFRDD